MSGYKPVATSENANVLDTKYSIVTPPMVLCWLNVILAFTILVFSMLETVLYPMLGLTVLMWFAWLNTSVQAVSLGIITYQKYTGGPSIVSFPKLKVYTPSHFDRPWSLTLFLMLLTFMSATLFTALYNNFNNFITAFSDIDPENTTAQEAMMLTAFGHAQMPLIVGFCGFLAGVCHVALADAHQDLSPGMRVVQSLRTGALDLQTATSQLTDLSNNKKV